MKKIGYDMDGWLHSGLRKILRQEPWERLIDIHLMRQPFTSACVPIK